MKKLCRVSVHLILKCHYWCLPIVLSAYHSGVSGWARRVSVGTDELSWPGPSLSRELCLAIWVISHRQREAQLQWRARVTPEVLISKGSSRFNPFTSGCQSHIGLSERLRCGPGKEKNLLGLLSFARLKVSLGLGGIPLMCRSTQDSLLWASLWKKSIIGGYSMISFL